MNLERKILFCTGIYPPDMGGPATYVKKFGQALLDEGYSVEVLSYGEKNIQFNDTGLPVQRIEKVFFLFDWIIFFFLILRKGRHVDVIYLQGSFSDGIPTTLANLFLRKKLIIRIGGVFSWEYALNSGLTKNSVESFLAEKQGFRCEILKFLDFWVISRASHVVANSNYSKKLLLLSGIPSDKISVIPNSFDTPLLPSANLSQELPQILQGKKILLFVGRFVEQKNLPLLFHFLNEIAPEFSLLLVGDGPQLHNLQKLSQELGLEERICFFGKGTKQDLSFFYKNSDVLILLSSYEGMSHVLLEAMSFKMPIIASNIEPNEETLAGYQLGHILEPTLTNVLDALAQISQEKQLRENYQYDFSKYTFENIYKDTKNILCI